MKKIGFLFTGLALSVFTLGCGGTAAPTQTASNTSNSDAGAKPFNGGMSTTSSGPGGGASGANGGAAQGNNGPMGQQNFEMASDGGQGGQGGGGQGGGPQGSGPFNGGGQGG